GPPYSRFAAAGFSDEAKRFTRRNREAHAIDREHRTARALEQPAANRKMLFEVVHLEHGILVRHCHLCKFRASANRRPNGREAFLRKADIARGSDPVHVCIAARKHSRSEDLPALELSLGSPAVVRPCPRPRRASTAAPKSNLSNRAYKDAAVAQTIRRPVPLRLCARHT